MNLHTETDGIKSIPGTSRPATDRTRVSQPPTADDAPTPAKDSTRGQGAAAEDRQEFDTHRRRVKIAWDERVTYEQVFDLDVPDNFTGDLWDLITDDDAPFREDEVPGVPAGYRCGWLDLIEPTARFAIEDRHIYDVTDTTAADPSAPAPSQTTVTGETGEADPANTTGHTPGHETSSRATGLAPTPEGRRL